MQSTVVLRLNYVATPSLSQPYPQFSKNPPSPQVAYQHKDAPICPIIAYQGAKILSIYMIWKWDAMHSGLEPQPCLYTITQCQTSPIFPISTLITKGVSA